MFRLCYDASDSENSEILYLHWQAEFVLCSTFWEMSLLLRQRPKCTSTGVIHRMSLWLKFYRLPFFFLRILYASYAKRNYELGKCVSLSVRDSKIHFQEHSNQHGSTNWSTHETIAKFIVGIQLSYCPLDYECAIQLFSQYACEVESRKKTNKPISCTTQRNETRTFAVEKWERVRAGERERKRLSDGEWLFVR